MARLAGKGYPAGMMRPAFAPILVALLAACGKDSTLESARFVELCGVAEPVLLLPLTPEQRPNPFDHSFLALHDRLLFVIGSGQRKIDDSVGPLSERASVYAVGLCGEEPAVIGPDVDQVFTNPNFPGVVFGCRWNTGELVRLDPTGVAPPEALRTIGCPVAFTTHGIVENGGTVFYPTLDSATATFGEPIALVDHVAPPLSDVHVLSHEILVIDGNSDLIRVSLPDFGTRVEMEDVASLKVSDDGRYMMTQGFVIGADDNSDGTAEIYVHDRSDGYSLMAGRGGELGTSGSRFVSDDLAIVRSVGGANNFQRIVKLPGLGSYGIPTQYSLRAPIPDGRWLAVREGSWFVLDFADEDEATLVTSLEGYAQAWTNEYVDLRTGDPASTRDTLPLIRFFFDPAEEPVQLAPRVTMHAIIQDDGRIVTPVEVDESWLGGLVLVDPEDQKERLIDERVAANGIARVGQYPGQPDVLIYAVVDGERTGVWVARPDREQQ